MMTVTGLYMCISYIYAYSYNLYDLSYLHAHCMPISFGTCFMSLAYLLFILLLYSCFYTLHIPYKFHILSCSYIVHVSYTFISRILSYNISYTVLYFYLHSYTFHIRYFYMLTFDTFHVLYFHMSFTCF